MKRYTFIVLLLLIFGTGVIPALAQQRDSDGDGVPNSDDKCPFNAGSRANGGCPELVLVANPPVPPADTDGDGLPDSDDQCPTVGGPRENRGCPVDNPPNNPPGENPPPANPDTNSGGDNAAPQGNPDNGDADGDGLPDSSDGCPTIPGTQSDNGCPPAGVPNNDVPPAGVPNPEPLPEAAAPLFVPPALPTDGCYVTPAANNINVRNAPNASAGIVGFLKAGTVYPAEGYIMNGTEIWFVMNTYEGASGATGYSFRQVLLASACAEIDAESPAIVADNEPVALLDSCNDPFGLWWDIINSPFGTPTALVEISHAWNCDDAFANQNLCEDPFGVWWEIMNSPYGTPSAFVELAYADACGGAARMRLDPAAMEQARARFAGCEGPFGLWWSIANSPYGTPTALIEISHAAACGERAASRESCDNPFGLWWSIINSPYGTPTALIEISHAWVCDDVLPARVDPVIFEQARSQLNACEDPFGLWWSIANSPFGTPTALIEISHKYACENRLGSALEEPLPAGMARIVVGRPTGLVTPGTVTDCDNNGLPDYVETPPPACSDFQKNVAELVRPDNLVTPGTVTDCDGNGLPDYTETPPPACSDFQKNELPDDSAGATAIWWQKTLEMTCNGDWMLVLEHDANGKEIVTATYCQKNANS